ncbi:LsrR, transcriptional repressor of lsr operon [Klebsiella pneumoniae]|nr:LsrR, transcriptional repressor of lsr operon [Klebsiella pneumoniae]
MSEKRITEENRYAGLALAEEELVARVAWCYYHDGLTQMTSASVWGCRG